MAWTSRVRAGRTRCKGCTPPSCASTANPATALSRCHSGSAVVCGGLLAWGGYYIGSYTADFRRDVFDRADLKDVAPPAAPQPDPNPKTVDDLKRIGEQKYQTVCASCHGPEGKGQPAQNIPAARRLGVGGGRAGVCGAAHPHRAIRAERADPGERPNVQRRGDAQSGQCDEGLRDCRRHHVCSQQLGEQGGCRNARGHGRRGEAARAKEGTRKANGTQPVSHDELLQLPPTYSDTGKPADTAPKASGKP